MSKDAENHQIDRFFLKAFDAIALVYDFLKLVPGGSKVVEKCLNSEKFKEIFGK